MPAGLAAFPRGALVRIWRGGGTRPNEIARAELSVPPALKAAAALGLGLRPMRDDDLAFAAAIYAASRAEELAQTGWPPEMRQAFLAQQHEAQYHHYRTHYPGAEWLIVEHDGEPVGRFYLVEWEREFRVIDISLAPAACGRGFGGALLADLIAAAASIGKAVTIHVERNNPALRLYDRLGFELAEDKGVYLLLQWRPAM